MSENEKRFLMKNQMTELTNAPKDVMLGMPIITCYGNQEMCIENYRGILEYTDQLIRVQTKHCQLRISGKRLQIEYYMNDEMKIIGFISALEFCK